MTAIEINDPFTPEATSSWYRSMRQFWHAVAYSAELAEGGVMSVRLLSQRLMIVRREGDVHAFSDVCRHKGAAVSLGYSRDAIHWKIDENKIPFVDEEGKPVFVTRAVGEKPAIHYLKLVESEGDHS